MNTKNHTKESAATSALTKADIPEILAALNVKENELGERVNAIKRDVGHKLNPDSSERAVELENSDVLTELTREANKELEKVHMAQSRIKEGTYGTCMQCEQPIQRKRLLAYPQALHCIDCKREQEHVVQ